MPLIPPKNRTISLTLESDLQDDATSGNPQNLRAPSQSFVSRFLPTSGLVGAVARSVLGTSEPTLKLVGPMSIDFAYEADVAAEPGLFTSFLQPWFVKPITVSIKGESYLGTYPIISRADRDVERVLGKLLTSLNDFSERVGRPGTGEKVLLEIANNPRGSRRFFGYIRRFSFGEQVNQPYILTYDIGFVGRSVDNTAIVKGKQNAQTALKTAGVTG